MNTRLENKFIRNLAEIKDPAVFLGVARVLKVQLMKDENTPRDFDEILRDVIDNYFAAPRKKQKELLEILKQANKCKESVVDGDNTKASTETGSNEKV